MGVFARAFGAHSIDGPGIIHCMTHPEASTQYACENLPNESYPDGGFCTGGKTSGAEPTGSDPTEKTQLEKRAENPTAKKTQQEKWASLRVPLAHTALTGRESYTV